MSNRRCRSPGLGGHPQGPRDVAGRRAGPRRPPPPRRRPPRGAPPPRTARAASPWPPTAAPAGTPSPRTSGGRAASAARRRRARCPAGRATSARLPVDLAILAPSRRHRADVQHPAGEGSARTPRPRPSRPGRRGAGTSGPRRRRGRRREPPRRRRRHRRALGVPARPPPAPRAGPRRDRSPPEGRQSGTSNGSSRSGSAGSSPNAVGQLQRDGVASRPARPGTSAPRKKTCPSRSYAAPRPAARRPVAAPSDRRSSGPAARAWGGAPPAPPCPGSNRNSWLSANSS